jgi:hypothetical protein
MAESKRLERLLAKPVIGTQSQVITLTRPATFTTTINRRQPTWRETGPASSSSETLNTHPPPRSACEDHRSRCEKRKKDLSIGSV